MGQQGGWTDDKDQDGSILCDIKCHELNDLFLTLSTQLNALQMGEQGGWTEQEDKGGSVLRDHPDLGQLRRPCAGRKGGSRGVLRTMVRPLQGEMIDGV